MKFGTDRADASQSNSLVQAGLCSYRKEPFSVRMTSTNFDKLPRTLGEKTERDVVSRGAVVAAERVVEPKADRDNLLLRLNYYSVSKNIF